MTCRGLGDQTVTSGGRRPGPRQLVSRAPNGNAMLPKPREEPCFLRSQLSQDRMRSEERAREGDGKRVSGRASSRSSGDSGPYPRSPSRLNNPGSYSHRPAGPHSRGPGLLPGPPGIAKARGLGGGGGRLSPRPVLPQGAGVDEENTGTLRHPTAAVRTHHAGPRRRVYHQKVVRLRGRPPRRQGRGLACPPHSPAGSRPPSRRWTTWSGAWTGWGRLASRLRSLKPAERDKLANLRIIATGSLLRPKYPGVRSSGLSRVGDLDPPCFRGPNGIASDYHSLLYNSHI